MKVGDYGYVKGISRDYGIGKITQLNSGYSSNDGELIDIQFKHFKHSIPKKNVISSPNIIDLIEIGDYVNGIKITDVYDDDKEVNDYNLKHKKCLGTNVYDEDFQEKLIYEEDIKSIVTKEQFESMEYKVC